MRTTLRATLLVLASLVVIFPSAVLAADKHTPTLDESLSLKTLGGPRISPDGKYIAYTVNETDWKGNQYISHIWLVETATGRRFQLTHGAKSSAGGEWSPDGRWLAFATEREAEPTTEPESAKTEEKPQPAKGEEKPEANGKPAARQIWLISPEGGEAWQLTKSETEVGQFHWSKDGKQIAFLATIPKPKPVKDRGEKYSDYEVYEKDYEQRQLWAVDVEAALKAGTPVKARQLTRDARLNVGSFSWSPDSARIVFSATSNPLLAFSSENSDIYLLDLGHDNAVHKLVALPGPDQDPVFSPDGRQIAFSSSLSATNNNYYVNSHIVILDVEQALAHPAERFTAVNDLTAKFDEDPGIIDWGPDGIYFDALQKTASHVFRLNPATHAITRITAPDNYAAGGVSFSKDFKTMALTSSDAEHMSELFISAVAPFAPRRLTDMNDQLKDFILGSSEMVSWKSSDGTVIEGALHKPADFDPHKKYPLLVVIHGGPTGISRALMQPVDRYYPIQIFLSKGALVLEPNYRGSAGYGQAFRSLNVRNLGVGDMADVMSGVDSLIARGMVDPARLGAMGWSQGGYISAFLATHTDRFKAISVGAGISDWATYYVSTDITPFTRQYLQATPWDDPAIYAKTSPITTIKQAKTPTLIQQGSADKRVPVPDSFELFRGLQDQKVPSRMILYTGYGHPITKPKSNRAVVQSNLDWFAHYIWGEPIPKGSPLLGTSELEATQ